MLLYARNTLHHPSRKKSRKIGDTSLLCADQISALPHVSDMVLLRPLALSLSLSSRIQLGDHPVLGARERERERVCKHELIWPSTLRSDDGGRRFLSLTARAAEQIIRDHPIEHSHTRRLSSCP
jgi:hypothetical protein